MWGIISPMKKTRVLLAAGLFPPDIGGPATYGKLIVEELSLRNFSFRVVPFRQVKKWPKVVRHVVYFFKLVANSRGCDLIYALDPVSVGVPALLASWLMGKSFTLRIGGDYAWEQSVQKKKTNELLDEFLKNYSQHSFSVRFLSAVQKFVAREAMCVIAPSEYLRSVVLRWGVRHEKVVVVHNAFEIPHGLPTRDEARRKLGVRGKVMLSVGRLVPWKGFDLLIELLPELLKKYPDLTLHILGEGPKRQFLENLAEKKGVREKVFFHGAVPHRCVYFEYCIRGAFASAFRGNGDRSANHYDFSFEQFCGGASWEGGLACVA